MSKNRYINTKIWSDNYFINLDPIEKLLFLYLLTNEKTNICGVYELPLKIMSVETGIEKDMLEKILKRFEENNKIKYSSGWIAIKNFIKHQDQGSPKVKLGIENELKRVPEEMKGYIYGIDTLCHLNLIKLNNNLTELENESNQPLKKEKLDKKEYGELNNVYLSDLEYNTLIKDYGIDIINQYIKNLSVYIPNRTLKPYKDHNAVIRSWLNKDKIKKIELAPDFIPNREPLL